jgi:hypothetical protein
MDIRACRRVSKSNQSRRADDVQTTLEKTEQHLMRITANIFWIVLFVCKGPTSKVR